MALLFTDSFDGIISAGKKWDSWHGNNVLHTDYGRNGTKGLKAGEASGVDVVFSKIIAPATNRVVIGTWILHGGSTFDTSTRDIRIDSTTGSQAWVRFSSSNSRFEIGGTGITEQQVGDTGIGQTNTWIFLEVKWEPGVIFEVRANNIELVSLVPGGSGTPNSFRSHEARNRQFEDLYVLDSSGSFNNDFLGPIKMTNIKPNGVGTRTDMTPSDPVGVGDNYQHVNDGSDATYVEGDVGQGDTYAFEDLPGSDDVLGAIQFTRMFDSDGGAITGRAIALVSATEYDGDDHVMPGSVGRFSQPWDANPDTLLAWTPAEIGAAEFGVEFA